MSKNHTGTSMCGTIIYRNQKPMKESHTPACCYCGHFNKETSYCSAGDVPFLQEDMTVAERCRFYTGKKARPTQGYVKTKDKKGNYSYTKKRNYQKKKKDSKSNK